LQLPLCVYFGNTESEGERINELMAEAAGFNSSTHAKGKTVRAVYTSKTANLIIENDNMIMKANQIKIIEEDAVRKENFNHLSCLSVKMPWYGCDNKVIGLFGFSILMGKQPLAESLTLIANLGFLSLHTQNSLLDSKINAIYLSKREAECLRLTARGCSAKQVAYQLGISQRTVEEYLNNIKLKFGVFSKSELIEKGFAYFKETLID
jgi:DNA-binding CsgD family transcriptional regulator